MWDHHGALLAGYGAALSAFLVLQRALPGMWPRPEQRFARPWLEVGLALLAALAVIGIGQLYLRGWLLAEREDGGWGRCGNQVLIFAPIPLLLALRRQSLATAWLPTNQVPARLAAGFGLALLALVVFHLLRADGASLVARLARIFHPHSLDEAVQVFLEDFIIAVLMVRLGAASGPFITLIIVAVLFAGGHVPSLLAQGATPADFASLGLDLLLALAVLAVVRRSADIWWFWCVHFVMDMTQFVPAGS